MLLETLTTGLSAGTEPAFVKGDHPGLDAAADTGPVRGLGDGVTGRLVQVTGAGPVGLTTALFARALGAREDAVADADPRRRALAERLDFFPLDLTDDPGRVLKTRWRHGPCGHGADLVFQCRGKPETLHAALRALRPQGSVVDLAFSTAGADAVRLGEDLHHTGLTLRCARIGRVPAVSPTPGTGSGCPRRPSGCWPPTAARSART